MMTKPNSPEHYIEIHPQWTEELTSLRAMMLDTDMEEAIKWNFPCYHQKGRLVMSIGATKNYVAIWFFHGVFLSDEAQKLYSDEKSKAKGMRQWRFTSLEEIQQDEDLIKAYIYEAMHNSEQGLEVKPQRNTKPVIIPPELQQLFEKKPSTHMAFEKLSKSKQREYANYIAEAKREATKIKRLEKIEPLLLAGKGLNDKYRDC